MKEIEKMSLVTSSTAQKHTTKGQGVEQQPSAPKKFKKSTSASLQDRDTFSAADVDAEQPNEEKSAAGNLHRLPLPTVLEGKPLLKRADFESFCRSQNKKNLPVVLVLGAKDGNKNRSIVGVDFLRGLPKNTSKLSSELDGQSSLAFLLPGNQQFNVPVKSLQDIDSSGYLLNTLMRLNNKTASLIGAAEGKVLFSACLSLGILGKENMKFAQNLSADLSESETRLGVQEVFFTSMEIQNHALVREMIRRGADVNADFEAMSPLELANRLGDSKLAEMLEAAGAVNEPTMAEDTTKVRGK